MEKLIERGWDIPTLTTKRIQNNVFRVKTGGGDFALKASPLKEKSLDFICAAENSLSRHGFFSYAPLIPTKTGAAFYREKGDCFTLHQWIEGNPCDFDRCSHLQAVGETLAGFHLRAREKNLPTEAKNRSGCFQRGEKLLQRLKDLDEYNDLAKTMPEDAFARVYRSLYPTLREKAQKALEQLNRSTYPRLAAEAEAVGSFIHYDVAARNFIMKEGKAYLIDFDYCCRDLPLTDLMRLTKRALKRGENYREKITAIFDSYQYDRKLSKAEAEVLCALLLFPQKFWRISHRYFSEEKDRQEEFYLKKMSYAAAELKQEDTWLEELRNRLEVSK